MFGKKKKKAQEQAAAERQQQLKQLNSLADEINSIGDAGERLFRLEELKEAIRDVIEGKETDIKDRADKKGSRLLLGSNAVQVPALFGITLATGMLPVFLLSFPVLFGTMAISNQSAKKTKKRLEEENADFLKELEGLEGHVAALADKVLDEHLEAIAKSARRDEIFEKFPDVKSRFGIAAAKKMAANDSKPKPPEQDDYKPGFNP
jgi:cell division protein FtsB